MSTATMAFRRSRAELEEAIGVEPIEVLQARRRDMVRKIAPLRARYGERGTWEVRRKLLRYAKMTALIDAVEQEMARSEKAGVPTKRRRNGTVSEAEAERLVSSEPSYIKLIDEMEREMAEYTQMENDITDITERINRDNALIKYATFEPRA